MTTLRDLGEDLAQIQELANDPESDPRALDDTIEGLQGMFEDKAVRIVHVLANNDSDVAAIDAEIKRLQDRKKVMVNGKERLKDYLRYNMEKTGVTKISSPLFTITLAKGRSSVVVEDDSALPEDYKRVTVSPDKTLIAKAIKDGYDVPGARLEQGQPSVRIK